MRAWLQRNGVNPIRDERRTAFVYTATITPSRSASIRSCPTSAHRSSPPAGTNREQTSGGPGCYACVILKEPIQRVSENLLERVARGDTASVSLVLERYAGLVWSLARRATSNQAEAEDAVQEIFTDVWRSAARFDPSVASEATFIAMIARRRLIDRRRREGRRIDEQGGYEEIPAYVGPSTGVSDTNEEAMLAVRALEALKPDQQNVLRMSVLQGMSHEKIAEATGLPLGTVKTHVRRGLIRIRELLEQARAKRGMGVAL